MTAIDVAFRRLRASGEKGLVIYLTAGDPTPPASLRYLRAAAEPGPTILELWFSLFGPHGGRPHDRGRCTAGAGRRG